MLKVTHIELLWELSKSKRLISIQTQDGDAPEIQKKVIFCFRIMSRSFADPTKAEENFQILDQLKDANIWKILTNLVDPDTNFHQAYTFRVGIYWLMPPNFRIGFVQVTCWKEIGKSLIWGSFVSTPKFGFWLNLIYHLKYESGKSIMCWDSQMWIKMLIANSVNINFESSFLIIFLTLNKVCCSFYHDHLH